MAIPHLVTAAELERMGKRFPDFELVRGRLVPVSPAGGKQGTLAAFLAFELGMVVWPARLGFLYTAETGFVLARDPDIVRAPDLSFVSRERPAGVSAPRGFIEGAPDLAIEIRSPDNTMAELGAKAGEYLSGGARLVWIVDPASRQVWVHRRGLPPVIRSDGDVLDGGEVVPGFRLAVARLFELAG